VPAHGLTQPALASRPGEYFLTMEGWLGRCLGQLCLFPVERHLRSTLAPHPGFMNTRSRILSNPEGFPISRIFPADNPAVAWNGQKFRWPGVKEWAGNPPRLFCWNHGPLLHRYDGGPSLRALWLRTLNSHELNLPWRQRVKVRHDLERNEFPPPTLAGKRPGFLE